MTSELRLLVTTPREELLEVAMASLSKAWPYWPFPDIHDEHVKRLAETMLDALLSACRTARAEETYHGVTEIRCQRRGVDITYRAEKGTTVVVLQEDTE